jgi:hypothetical protein
LISACNPGSKWQTPDANRRRHEAMINLLAQENHRFAEASSSDARGRWLEPSCLVLDPSVRLIDEFAVRFAQLAILRWNRGAPVRLRLYGRVGKQLSDSRRMDTRLIESVACRPE